MKRTLLLLTIIVSLFILIGCSIDNTDKGGYHVVVARDQYIYEKFDDDTEIIIETDTHIFDRPYFSGGGTYEYLFTGDEIRAINVSYHGLLTVRFKNGDRVIIYDYISIQITD